MNRKMGMYSSLITFAAVVAFAASMFAGSEYISYLSSLFISWGFVPLICSFASVCQKEKRAAALTAVAFSSVYALLIAVVYFAQLTAVHFSQLSQQASLILNYSKFGLFFFYDLMGYGFMAFSTFFIGLTIKPQKKSEKWLKGLLLIHGVFAIACILIPLLGIFNADMPGGDLIGTLILEFWCAYFIPLCLLSFKYFKENTISIIE
ncbi:MAG: hypothetical protein AAGU14_11215 [Eubacteriaceae bacterium]